MLLFLLDKYVGVEWLDYMSGVYFWLPHIQGFHICRFDSTNWIENNLKKKMSVSSEKQNLNLPQASKYLYNIYIVFNIRYYK